MIIWIPSTKKSTKSRLQHNRIADCCFDEAVLCKVQTLLNKKISKPLVPLIEMRHQQQKDQDRTNNQRIYLETLKQKSKRKVSESNRI